MMSYGEELEPTLERVSVDVLILDVSVPTSAENANPYPILYLIPKILDRHPEIAIMVVSMHIQRTLVRALMEAGASGFILKDDQAAIVDLPAIVRLVQGGGVYLSQRISDLLKANPAAGKAALTPRQVEVLSYCSAYPNLTTAELAQKLQIAGSTVRNLLSAAYLHLGVSTRAAAIARARTMGLIPEE